MTKLERSPDYYRKLNFLKVREVPIQTEIKLRIGLALSDRIFESTDPAVRELTGTRPLKNGPPDELWVSPSDLLINYVRLKPPLTSKYIQALTHQGILEIGSRIERNFVKKIHDKSILQLRSLEEMLKYLAKRDVNQAIKCAVYKLKDQFARYLEELDVKFEERLKEALDKQKAEMLAEQEVAVLQAKLEVKQMMQMKAEELITVMVRKIISQYGEALEQQSQKWHNHFKHHMKLAEEHLVEQLERKRQKYKEKLKELHADLQSDFIANMMYIICSERRKCEYEKKEILEKEAAKILSLQEALKDTKQKLQEMVIESGERVGHITSREEVLFNIIKQFQKFIYFVLRAVPQQAEYLLDIEKLMVFELTKITMELKPELFKGASLLDLTKRASKSQSFIAEEELNVLDNDFDYFDLLKVPDYHNCENIERVDRSAHSLTESQDLPAFRYGSNIFIREDFRNMISQGLVLSQNNEHWNWDVEELTRLLTQPQATCLQDQTSEKYPCLSPDKPPVHSSLVPPESIKRKFYETCIAPCIGEKSSDSEIAVPEFTDRVCDLSCIKEQVGMPCDICCKQKPDDEKIKVDRDYESDSKIHQKPTLEIQGAKSCHSCALLKQDPFSTNDDVVCDCYPMVERPSLTEIKKFTGTLLEEAKRGSVLDKRFSELLPKPKSVPIHFAADSQEILRLSVHKRQKQKKEEEERAPKKSLSMKTKVKPIIIDIEQPIKPLLSTSKISSARDSVELIKYHSNLSQIEKTWTKKDKISIDSEDSGIGDYRTLGQMTNYLEKLKRISNKSRDSAVSNVGAGTHGQVVQKTSLHYKTDPGKKSSVFAQDLYCERTLPYWLFEVLPSQSQCRRPSPNHAVQCIILGDLHALHILTNLAKNIVFEVFLLVFDREQPIPYQSSQQNSASTRNHTRSQNEQPTYRSWISDEYACDGRSGFQLLVAISTKKLPRQSI